MVSKSYIIMSLGMVLDLVIFVLISLSLILLYSLLVISVESKTFMLGVMRMLRLLKYRKLFI